MVDIKTIRPGMQLLFYEPNILRLLEKEGKKPGEIEKQQEKTAFLGKVFSVDLPKNEIALMVRGEIRTFSPDALWSLPDEAGKTTMNASSDKVTEKLMSLIVGIHDGRVGSMGLQEVADILRKRGVKPIRAQELIEVL